MKVPKQDRLKNYLVALISRPTLYGGAAYVEGQILGVILSILVLEKGIELKDALDQIEAECRKLTADLGDTKPYIMYLCHDFKHKDGRRQISHRRLAEKARQMCINLLGFDPVQSEEKD